VDTFPDIDLFKLEFSGLLHSYVCFDISEERVASICRVTEISSGNAEASETSEQTYCLTLYNNLEDYNLSNAHRASQKIIFNSYSHI
jgi:hypothetical protein